MKISIGPWRVDTHPVCGLSRLLPVGASASIDMGRRSEIAGDGWSQSPGVGFFAYPDDSTLPDGHRWLPGMEDPISQVDRDAVTSLLDLSGSIADTTGDLIREIRCLRSDPSGADTAKPDIIAPNGQGAIVLGEQRINVDMTPESVFFQRPLDRMQRDFRNLVAAVEQGKYPVDLPGKVLLAAARAWRVDPLSIRPRGLEHITPITPSTTLTEMFPDNFTASTTGAHDFGDNEWYIKRGGYEASSAKLRQYAIDANFWHTAYVNTALSSSDHYCQLGYLFFTPGYAGPMIRGNSGTGAYSGYWIFGSPNTEYSFWKSTADTHTQLAGYSENPNTSNIRRLDGSGSTLTVSRGGSAIITTTDSSHTGLYAGVRTYWASGGRGEIHSVEISDGLGGGGSNARILTMGVGR